LDAIAIVFNARFVPCAGGNRQADTADQAVPGKVLDDQSDGSKGNRR
jgi:hypothetical protein